MQPTKIEGANRIFGAPEDWDPSSAGECAALQVLDDGEHLQSTWAPDAAELAALNAGQPVLLTLWAREHPVISIGVLAPFSPDAPT